MTLVTRNVNGNDASVELANQLGWVVYVKEAYGFIRPDNKEFDDLFFHVTDVEPWREGYKQLIGFRRTPFYRGERVRFSIKKSGKMVTRRDGTQVEGYKAINIEILPDEV